MALQDLNDLYYYAHVVDNGGFAPAGRALGIPKSKLSRRIALLEERLNVRLIQRSTRRFAVTEIGQIYYEHCKAMLVEAEAAAAAETSRSGTPNRAAFRPTGFPKSRPASTRPPPKPDAPFQPPASVRRADLFHRRSGNDRP